MLRGDAIGNCSLAIRKLDKLADITDAYDAVFCDVWGVLHNGVRSWPAAWKALIAEREAGRAPNSTMDQFSLNEGTTKTGARMEGTITLRRFHLYFNQPQVYWI